MKRPKLANASERRSRNALPDHTPPPFVEVRTEMGNGWFRIDRVPVTDKSEAAPAPPPAPAPEPDAEPITLPKPKRKPTESALGHHLGRMK